MKKILLMMIFMSSCIRNIKESTDLSQNKLNLSSYTSEITSAEYTINNQLILKGSGLGTTESVKVEYLERIYDLNIISSTKSKLILSFKSVINVTVNMALKLFISNAYGQVTIPLNIQIDDGRITREKIADGAIDSSKLSSMGANDGEVLIYDGNSWSPGNLSGLIFKGVWSSSSIEPDDQALNGDYYLVESQGAFDIGDGEGVREWKIGDWIVYSSDTSSWKRLSASVNGNFLKKASNNLYYDDGTLSIGTPLSFALVSLEDDLRLGSSNEGTSIDLTYNNPYISEDWAKGISLGVNSNRFFRLGVYGNSATPSRFYISGNYLSMTPWNDGHFIIDYMTKNVGIGTISPSQKLDVNGTVKAIAFEGDGSALINIATTNVASSSSADISAVNDINLKIGTSTKLKITNDGKLSAGHGEDPNYLLDVRSSGQSDIGITSYSNNPAVLNLASNSSTSPSEVEESTSDNTNLGKLNFSGHNGTDFIPVASIEGHSTETYSGTSTGSRLIFKTTNTASTGASEKMIITNDGKVGVGNSDPSEKLDVVGSGKFSESLQVGNVLNIEGDGISILHPNNLITGDWSKSISFGINTDHFFRLGAFGNGMTPTRFYLSGNKDSLTPWSDGHLVMDYTTKNIGIGILSPTEKLEVGGNIRASQFIGDGSRLINITATAISTTSVINVNGTSGVSLNVNDIPKFILSTLGSFSVGHAEAPEYLFDIRTSGSSDVGITSYAGNSAKLILGSTSQAVVSGNESATINDTKLGEINFAGHNGMEFITSAYIESYATETYQAGRTGGNLIFKTTGNLTSGADEKMRIEDNGNVGIGTNNPTEKLEVNGNMKAAAFIGNGASLTDVIGVSVSSTSMSDINGQEGVSLSVNGIPKFILNNSSDFSIGHSKVAEYLVDIRNSGQSDIGITSYSNNPAVLNLASNSSTSPSEVEQSTALNTNLGKLNFSGHDGTNFVVSAYIESYATEAYSSGNTGGNLVFSTTDSATSGASEKMRILGNGYVGIGTNNPGYALDISGDIHVSRDIYVAGCLTSAPPSTVVHSGTCLSDGRLKDQIEDVKESLFKILKLRPVEYIWKSELYDIHGRDGKDIGLIAQELEQVFPEMVIEKDDSYKRIKYGLNLQLYLISAFKEFFNLFKDTNNRFEEELYLARKENREMKDFICQKYSDASFCN